MTDSTQGDGPVEEPSVDTASPNEPSPDAPSDDVGTPGNRPCPAGKDCKGEYEHENPRFTGKDYFFMAVGISSRPVPIERKCALCGHIWEIERSRRPW